MNNGGLMPSLAASAPLIQPPVNARPRPGRRLATIVLVAICSLPTLGRAEKHDQSWARTAPAACQELIRHLPNVTAALCRETQLLPGPGRSVLGRPILMRDLPAPDAKLRVLVLGGIHGDELSSSSVALHWLSLAQNQPVDLPHPVHWRFIPALNPDGLASHPPKRVNANGVDLNRNFPTPRWDREAPLYWEKRTRKDPRRWPGPKPLSEPESRYLHEEMARFKPHLIVSVHAPFGVLDFDGPSVPPARLGRLYLDQVGIYPGSLGNYGGVHKGVPVVTVTPLCTPP